MKKYFKEEKIKWLDSNFFDEKTKSILRVLAYIMVLTHSFTAYVKKKWKFDKTQRKIRIIQNSDENRENYFNQELRLK